MVSETPPPLPQQTPPPLRQKKTVALWIGFIVFAAFGLLLIAVSMSPRGAFSALGTQNVTSQGTEATPETGRRVRTLSMGGEFKPLEIGAGNPLRVGNEVKSIVYVIDRSGSMSGPRFREVGRALIDAIEGLNDSQDFAVILFESSPHPIDRRLVAATSANKKRVRQALARVVPGGGTEPYAAMKIALDLSPEAIVLLSDGEFSPAEASQITGTNQARRNPITIHCIGLDKNITTLRQIAASNGNGIYVSVQIQDVRSLRP
jgi:Mg-chelatase subunit ChlD